MSFFEGQRKTRHVRRQSGIFTLLNLGVLIMAVGALSVLGVGQVAWERGRLQQIADLAALTAARQMADGPDFTVAREIASQNGLRPTDTLVIQCVIDGEVTDDCQAAVTARVTVTREVNPIFTVFQGGPLVRLAEATNTPTVLGTVGSGLVSIDTQKSALLNGLLTALGGGNINLSVAQYGALLNADVKVNLLDLIDLHAGVLTMDDLLDLDVTALSLLQDALTVGNADQATLDNATGVLSLLSVPLNQITFRLGDLLAVDLSGREDTALAINLGTLAQVAITKSLEGGSYQIPLNLSALGITLDLQLLQAPQVFVGRKMPYDTPIVTARTSQVALSLNVATPLGNLDAGIASLGLLNLSLQLKAGSGYAQVDDLACHFPRADNVTQVTVVPALLDVCLAESSAGMDGSVDGLTCGDPAEILELKVLGLVDVEVDLGAAASVRSDPTTVYLEGPAPLSQTVTLPLSQSLGNLLGNLALDLDLDIDMPVLGFLLKPLLGTINGLLSALPGLLEGALRPILFTVGGILDDLLGLLGVTLNEVTVDINSVDCQSVSLTR